MFLNVLTEYTVQRDKKDRRESIETGCVKEPGTYSCHMKGQFKKRSYKVFRKDERHGSGDLPSPIYVKLYLNIQISKYLSPFLIQFSMWL